MSYARIFLKFFILDNTITPVRRVGGGCSRRKPPSHLDLLATVPVSERGRGPRRRCTGPAAARGETRKSADRYQIFCCNIYTHGAPPRGARAGCAPRPPDAPPAHGNRAGAGTASTVRAGARSCTGVRRKRGTGTTERLADCVDTKLGSASADCTHAHSWF